MTATRALVMIVLVGAVGGCGRSRTEAVIVVTAEGLRVPGDVDSVHVQVYDAQNPTPALWDESYTLCNDVITFGCVTLPFTMTLIPGHRTPSDSTRVVISARRGQVDRIDDAAIFTFTSGESLRLDFVLYANCLDKVDCADINQVCGPDRMCGPIHPVPFGGEPDLGQHPGPDLGAAGDLSGRALTDLLTPADLAGCVPVCQPNSCAMSNCNTPCVCGANSVCMGNQCVPCGNAHDECCPGDQCSDQSVCNTVNNSCECGGAGQPCCAPDNTCNDLTLGCVGAGQGATCQLVDMGTPPPPDQVLDVWDRQIFSGAVAPPSTFNGISGAGSLVVAVGPAGSIWKYSGAANTWTKMHSNGSNDTASDFSRVWLSASNHGYAVGKSGLIDVWDGASWTVQLNAFSSSNGYDYNGVWCNGTDVWVTGVSGGTGVIAHNGSGAWVTGSGLIAFDGVWSEGSASALVGGTDAVEYVARDDGSSLTFATQNLTNGTTAPSYKAWGESASSAWFSSRAGDVAYYDGSLTADLMPQSNIAFNAIHGFGSGPTVDLWVVGENTLTHAPVIFHAVGAPPHAWTAQINIATVAANTTFNDVVALGPRDLYIVGTENGAPLIFHAHSP